MLKMLKSIGLLLLFFITSVEVFAQEPEGAIQKRHDFFYNPRAYPFDSISSNAYINAFQQKENLNNSQGFYYSTNLWSCLGPTPLHGYYSGRIGFIKYDPRSPNVVYLGAADGGIWKSVDGGSTWLPKTDRLPTLSCGAIAIDVVGNVIYYGSGDAVWTSIGYTGDGIYKSTDFGDNWEKINSSGLPARTNFSKILVSPLDNSVLYAALNTGFYRSTNQGINWTRLIPAEDEPARICSDAVISPNGMNIYAIGPGNYCPFCGTQGIDYWKSSDGGQTFVPMPRQNTGFPHFDPVQFPPGRTRITLCESNPNILYIVTMNDQILSQYLKNPHYVYKSVDYGETFTLINNGLPTTWAGDNSSYDIFIQVSPHDPNLVFEGAVSLFRSTNGSTFQPTTGYAFHADFHCMDFHPAQNQTNILLVGCDGGVYRSTDWGSSNSWQNQNSTLTLTQIYKIDASSTNNSKLIGGAQDNGMIYNFVNPVWAISNAQGDGGNVVYSPTRPDISISNICNGGGMWRSIDCGVNWDPSSNYFGGWDWLVTMAAHPTEAGTFYMMRNSTQTNGRFHLFKSTDDGVNWSDGQNSFSFFDNVNLENVQPENLAISSSNPGVMYLSAGKRISVFHKENPFFKSTDGGLNWSYVFKGGERGVPDRFFSHIEVDPGNPNEVLLTVSGFESGHVFRTQDGGDNWQDISGNLPDNPANDIIVHYIDCDTKEYIIATDAGVFRTNSDNISWQELANNLPNSAAVDLELHALTKKLRVSTFGRGVWEIDLKDPVGADIPIYIKGNMVIPASMNIDQDIVVCSGGMLSIPNECTLSFAEGKKIVVQDWGVISVAPSQGPVTLTSQSGLWGGVEFQGNTASGNLNGCVFQSTETPVVCNWSSLRPAQPISIMGCSFKAPVTINKKQLVTVWLCTWDYSAATPSTHYPVCGVDMINASHATVRDNTIIYLTSPSQSSIGINVTYGNYNSIFRNQLINIPVGVQVSNGSVFLSQNWISYEASYPPLMAICGVGTDNIYSSSIRYVNVTGYVDGFKLINSSPNMFLNSSINTLNNSGQNGLNADNQSNPKLKPTISEGQYIWDGGQNTLKCTFNGNGIYIDNESLPDIDVGYNNIFGTPYNISGTPPQIETYNATYNCWDGDPSGKFNLPGITVNYDPVWCDPPPEGGGTKGEDNPDIIPNITTEIVNEPPQPLIFDHGNGIYETLIVSTGSVQPSTDNALFFTAKKQELLGNFSSAVNLYKEVVLQYPHSVSALNSLRRIMYCHDRLNSDTAAYSSLRQYYLGLLQINQTDTAFVNVASELAAKTLVRLEEYPEAITAYENIISNTTDSSVILCAELNIIETYMIMNNQQGGNAPQFTGSLKYLKPSSVSDAHKMIMEKIYKVTYSNGNKIIPKEFKLEQNFPNPFNPSTTIEYSLPNSTKITIKVYDLLGRLVKELVNEYKDAGVYKVKFDGTNLASGVYLYKIEAGTFVNVKKMVLVK